MKDPKVFQTDLDIEDESFIEDDETFQRGLENSDEDLSHLPEAE